MSHRGPAGNPETTLPARVALGLLHFYKQAISPWLPRACRYEPTCSVYAREAIERHGLARGSRLALARLLRCHPFRPGGFDPVP
ncbi:MAG TPA: membrane protein insertion efficiency factor YidD [Thermoanaerobaculia bacterium]|nr:membrane protein insertion efficiency factor YidD [Thermoanaerobaculia bacterium]